jgi:multidrug efflux system membrane fusion protein
LSVQALGDDNRTVVDRGTLTVIDNQVDQTTGTVKLKAEFPNKDLQIWPGQFVNVKLLVDTLRQVIVVPSAAVQRGPNGTFAYVANDDNTVTVHPVTVAQQDDMEAAIAEGIDDGERVVTTGFAQLTDGAKITIGTPEDQQRPAGSERRRGPPRQTPSAQSAPTPRTPVATLPREQGRAGSGPAETPSAGATPQPTPSEQSPGTAHPAQNPPPRAGESRQGVGGTTTATP